MFVLLKYLQMLIIGLSCCFCGRHGSESQTGKPDLKLEPSPPLPPVNNEKKTKVDFDTLPYKLTIDNDPSCKSQIQSIALADLETKFSGLEEASKWPALRDWPKDLTLGSDLKGDSQGSFDFGKIGFGRFREHLVIAWEDQPISTSTELKWEIGAIVSRQSQILRMVKYVVQLNDDQISLLSEGKVKLLGSKEAEILSTGDQKTLLISLQLLENVMTYPHWWLRGEAHQDKKIVDQTSASVFPSTYNPDLRLFAVSACTLDLPTPYDLPIMVVRDSDSISADGESESYEKKFLSQIRTFVKTNFLDQMHPLALKTTAQLFYLTRKEISAPTFRGFDTWEKSSADERAASVYQGSVIALQDLYKPLDPIQNVRETLVFNTVISRHFLLQENDLTLFHEPFSKVITLKNATHIFGKSFWLDQMADFSTQLQKLQSLTQLNQLEHLLILLDPYFELQDLWHIWRCFSESVRLDHQTEKWGVILKCIHPDGKLHKVLTDQGFHLSGWSGSGEYHPIVEPRLVLDNDLDGLPSFFENFIGTNPSNMDSDGDGWGDGGEWALGFSPREPLEHPDRLVADGSFKDWQILIPRKIILDKSRSGLCNESGDIDFYSSVVKKDALILGAVSPTFDIEKPLQWELDIELPMVKKRFLVRIPAKSSVVFIDTVEVPAEPQQLKKTPYLELLSGISPGQKALEFILPRQYLDPSINLSNMEAVRVRFRTRHSESQEICDETPWVQPVLKED